MPFLVVIWDTRRVVAKACQNLALKVNARKISLVVITSVLSAQARKTRVKKLSAIFLRKRNHNSVMGPAKLALSIYPVISLDFFI